MRIFAGRNAADDFESEYIAVTPDGATAFVRLKENNAVAKIDLASLTVVDILPLGLKDYSLPGNLIGANNKDDALVLGNQPVFGTVGYQARIRRKDKDRSSRVKRTISAINTSNGLGDAMRYRVRFR